MTTRRTRQRRDGGVLLGIVLVLLAVLFAAGIFALWSLRGDTGSAGRDRLSRQLLDCAEQGLAYGKQYFSATVGQNGIGNYVAANICSTAIDNSTAGPLPCWNNGGPFPTTCTGTPPTGYPNGSIFTKRIAMDQRVLAAGKTDFEYTIGVYKDPATVTSTLDACTYTNGAKVVVYSRCTDLNTGQQRSVQSLMSITPVSTNDYRGQAGRGYRNQGNQNF